MSNENNRKPEVDLDRAHLFARLSSEAISTAIDLDNANCPNCAALQASEISLCASLAGVRAAMAAINCPSLKPGPE